MSPLIQSLWDLSLFAAGLILAWAVIKGLDL